ncbi:HNH endonuclease [Marichromatium gracile]|uniref:HNH endonuclease signature motif containing protein n=1 Tax=Marichromatium gracile TaxID=1048 RepID=UPI001F215AA1|nr:HNH endonuclease [Marichromatium gracile]MCF1182630.1 HNH endonuclease [Marichromatium gracile]
MKLEIDFSILRAAVSRMGPPVEIEPIELQSANPPLPRKEVKVDTRPPPELEIPEGGMELTDLEQIGTANNLLTWRGQQVLLYIQDHRLRFEAARLDGKNGNKVHLSFCQTLEKMRDSGRFERYVVTRDHSERFRITGSYNGWREESATTDLKVCKYCLRKLNYGGYAVPGNKSAFSEFSFVKFFEQHESFFPYHPSREAGAAESYTKDWSEISSRYRESRQYICEGCGVDLSRDHSLLHTHHLNGVRSDNAEHNLKALCVDCHSKEPGHNHMAVPHKLRQRIAHLRQQQNKTEVTDWQKVFKLADPGLNGLLHHLKALRAPLPEVGLDIQDERGTIVANIELAWPKAGVGIAISEADASAAKAENWRIYSVEKCLEQPQKLIVALLQRQRRG